MSNINRKIEAYLGRKPESETEVKLQDDGQGVYIAFWSDSLDKPKPTDAQLDALETDATKLENNEQADANRRKDYLSVEEQLDYIYHNGITKWKTDHIKPIKDKYPKE